MSLKLAANLALAALAALLLGCGDPTVIRVVDGRPEAGRYIEASAYACYAHAAVAEASGDPGTAIRWIEAAARLDPDGPEAWTKLGRLRCQLAPKDRPAPREALADFDRAAKADRDFAPLHRERARCFEAHGQHTEALAAAERAMALDPEDAEAVILRAEALHGVGRDEDAERALRALSLRRPSSAGPWLALARLGSATGDAALAREAEARAAALSAKDAKPKGPSLVSVDAALAGGDLPRAERLAHAARLPLAELALRAAALGRTAIARDLADLVLGADPASSSARVARVVVADLDGDGATVTALLRDLPRKSAPLSPLARVLLAEVIARRVGDAEARALLEAAPLPADADVDDALLSRAARRLHDRGLYRRYPR